MTNGFGERPELGTRSALRALVVDDDRDTREMLEVLLASFGWRVVVVGSAEAALERFDPHETDVILTDLSMPDMDGFELLERLRERAGRRIPALAITGYDGEENKVQAAAAGFDGFVVKPFHVATLVDMVHRTLAEE